MRVSFDFDSTLDKPMVQLFAKSLVDDGLDVWIVTSRYDNDHLYDYKFPWASNSDLYDVAKKVGIPDNKIIFTNMQDKWERLSILKPIWHLDDDSYELNLINTKTKTIGISVWGQTNWLKKCKKIIEKNLVI